MLSTFWISFQTHQNFYRFHKETQHAFSATLFPSFSINFWIKVFIQIEPFSKCVRSLNWLIYLTIFFTSIHSSRDCSVVLAARERTEKHKSKKRAKVVNHNRNLCFSLHLLTTHELLLFGPVGKRFNQRRKRTAYNEFIFSKCPRHEF